MGQGQGNLCSTCGHNQPLKDQELPADRPDRFPPVIGVEDIDELQKAKQNFERKGEASGSSTNVQQDVQVEAAAAEAARLEEDAKAKRLAADEAEREKQVNIPCPVTRQSWQERRDADENDRRQREERRRAEDATRLQDFQRLLEERRKEWLSTYGEDQEGKNRYGVDSRLPAWEPDNIPTLALINPLSGAGAGRDILQLARRSPVYQNRFFNIIQVVRQQQRGGLLDLFRFELEKAKEEAKAIMVRPRLISGGGDGTASFAMWMIFRALKADDARAAEGLKDTGNGFIWTNEELESYFPALAQLPLGSANDFGNILGWGQKYPGDGSCCTNRLQALTKWILHVTSRQTEIVNFDVWGLMPHPGAASVDFKICELTGKKGRKPHACVDGKMQLSMKEAGKPTPFFICLYFSTGFGAYMVARFQINRRTTPLRNRVEYVRQAVGIVLESTPPQLNIRAECIEVDCEGEAYFPPRRHKGVRGKAYREVGFYNINWQAHLAHGADRIGLCSRMASTLSCRRPGPVCFNDGHLDAYRMRFTTYAKNPGSTMQTDKKKDFHLTYKGGQGKGIFFQYDGEARFAFSPTGEPFNMFVRKVLNVPVLLGPYRSKKLTEPVDNGQPVRFEFTGDNADEKDRVRRRVLKSLTDDLEKEVHATTDEISRACIPVPPP